MTNIGLTLKERERFRDFVSGLMAGIISVTVCNPLDIARTRLNVMVRPFSYSELAQPQRQQVHGIRPFHADDLERGGHPRLLHGYTCGHVGYKVNVKAIPIFHSLFFPIYEGMKEWCRSKNFPKWKEYLASTIVAGGFCNIVTNPIWVVRTRIMVQFLHPESRHYSS